MCGIVGYIGDKDAVGVIVDGLKRLEYRGYDSAGVAVLQAGKLEVRRAPGRIKALELRDAARRAQPVQPPVDDGDAGRVVAAVLQALQALEEHRHDVARRDRADYSAHEAISAASPAASIPGRSTGAPWRWSARRAAHPS